MSETPIPTPRTDALLSDAYGKHLLGEPDQQNVEAYTDELLRDLSALAKDLERELAAAVRDAERYRWLQANRGCGNERVSTDEGCYLQLNPRDMDAAIDSALAGKGEGA